MATGAQTWSTSAASNNSADGSVNWAEGMAPSAVNNSARAEMASVAMWIKDNSGALLTTGTTAAYTVTSKQVSAALTDGYTIAVNFHATNDAAASLNVDGLGAKKIQFIPGTNLSTGDITGGTSHRLHYSSSSTAWIVQGANSIGASAVSSDKIADDAVGLTKIADIANGTVLANVSGGAASPTAVTLGTGLSYSTTTLSAPAFPPASVYKNLSIKTATTTTIDCRADYVTLVTSGSSSFITLPASGTINMASTGVANGLSADSTALNYSTFYFIYAIAPTSTSTHADFLASVSATTPLMPSGYAYRARVGAQVTTTTTAVAALYGVYQYGNTAQYAVGMAGTTKIPNVANGAGGTYSATSPVLVAVPVAGVYVPTTASQIKIVAEGSYSGNTAGSVLVAPSTGWGGTNLGPTGSANTGWPIWLNVAATNAACLTADMILESTSIAWAGNATGSGISCFGWEDNI